MAACRHPMPQAAASGVATTSVEHSEYAFTASSAPTAANRICCSTRDSCRDSHPIILITVPSIRRYLAAVTAGDVLNCLFCP